MVQLERKRCHDLVPEGDGAPLGLVVLDREVDCARAVVDGDKQVTLVPFTVPGLQLRQVLDVEKR